MSESNKRLDILDELDEYNPAPINQHGSIMEGILAAEVENTSIQTRETSLGDETTTEVDKKELPNDYLPLNSSIQELTKQVDSRLTGIERGLTQRLDSLTNNYQQRQQPQQVWQPTSEEADSPVTLGQLSPITQRVEHASQMALKSYLRSELTRAHLEYERYKQANPNFEMNPQEIDYAIGQMAQKGQYEQLEGVNWRGHFDQMYRPKLDSKLQDYEKTIADLRKENETLKKRPTVSAAPAQVSPAVGRSTSRAIESPTDQANDDIVNMKTFRQKGNFKGFGNDLKRKLSVNK